MKTLLVSILFLQTLLFADLENNFPKSHIHENILLHRTGVAELNYKNIIRAYTGAFYIEKGVSPSMALGDVPKRLDIEYHLPIKARDFAFATRFLIKRNVGSERYAELEDSLAEFVELYEGVEDGDRYSLLYLPGRGTELFLNGRSLGLVNDSSNLSRELFSLWIGSKPIDIAFKYEILGMR